jgi:DNA-binding transcriptional regulator of glucitol operon
MLDLERSLVRELIFLEIFSVHEEIITWEELGCPIQQFFVNYYFEPRCPRILLLYLRAPFSDHRVETAFFYTARAELDHWQARHDHTSDDYQSAFDQLVAEGYRSTWVSGHAIENHPRFEGIWEKVKYPRWVTHHGMTASDYQSKFNAYVSDQAFRLTLVNGYTVDGVEFYCAIWDQSPSPPWVSKHGLTSSEYQSASDDFTSQGYVLTHVSGYSVGKDARYAAIWTKTDDEVPWVTRHGLNSADYQAAFDHYVGLGYRLELVSGYAIDGVDLCAGIWRKRPSGPWVARHGITAQEYQAEFDRYASNGYVLRVVSGYNSAEGERYAAILRSRRIMEQTLPSSTEP